MTSEHRIDLTGQTLMGKLRVIRLLGEGGMGAVYEVEHLITRHKRALKVMHQRYAASTETVARFIREAGVAGTLNTPHVVETYDAGQMPDGSPYVLMELLSGSTLAALVDSDLPLTPGRVVGIVCQVLEGLSVAHDAGIVHRDIKPDNVFVSQEERGKETVRLLDFGISKFAVTDGAGFDGTLTSDHSVMGTPYYMSPEQATGAKRVDERSDIYSVGVMLYEGLARVRPFDATNMASLVIKIHAGEYTPLTQVAPQISPSLAEVVQRAMHHDPSKRHASARALLEALLPFAESHYTSSLQTLQDVPKDGPIAPISVAPPRRVDPGAKTMAASARPPAPTRWRVPAAVAAVVVLLGGLGLFAMQSGGEPTEPAGAGEPHADVAATPAAVAPPPEPPVSPLPVAPDPPPEAPVEPNTVAELPDPPATSRTSPRRGGRRPEATETAPAATGAETPRSGRRHGIATDGY